MCLASLGGNIRKNDTWQDIVDSRTKLLTPSAGGAYCHAWHMLLPLRARTYVPIICVPRTTSWVMGPLHTLISHQVPKTHLNRSSIAQYESSIILNFLFCTPFQNLNKIDNYSYFTPPQTIKRGNLCQSSNFSNYI